MGTRTRASAPTASRSPSHRDGRYAKGAAALLADAGFHTNKDWEAGTMPSRPDKRTANRTSKEIASCDLFIFLATPESIRARGWLSKIGVADGAKSGNEIVLIQTKKELGRHYGSEYLDLNRSIDFAVTDQLGIVQPGTSKTRILVEALKHANLRDTAAW